MGKWGGREMTATSDLDFMLIYQADGMSDGAKPLAPAQYYSRLAQRLVNAITSPTAEGILYEADMRLRPSGSKGPVAVSLDAFAVYQREEAWTWEKMSLTRARLICGPETVREAIATALHQRRDTIKTLVDIRDMRSLMLKEHEPKSRWDLKRKRGGLIDIEFIVQALQLTSPTGVFRSNTRDAIVALHSAGQLSPADAAALREAWTLYTRLTQILRLSIDGDQGPENAPRGLQQTLLNATAMPDLARTDSLLDETALQIAKIFHRVIGVPA
jgi:glutamate-ammonia-ligase adenylyltransferase